MLAEEDRLGWVGAGMVCTWYVLSVVYLRKGTDCMERKQLGSVWVCLGTNQNSRVKVRKVGKYLIDRGNSRRKVPPFLSLSRRSL